MWSKKELIDKQADFWVHIAAGLTLTASCQAVGVDRVTGRRWRQATGGRIPRKRPAPSGRYLSLTERLQIADLHIGGATVRDIAEAIGRVPSTVSRELARNSSSARPGKRRKYAPYAAQERAQRVSARPKVSRFENPELAWVVQEKLCLKWSPQQISHHLSVTFPDRPQMQVSHESIYQAQYVQGRGHLRADLHEHLRSGRAVRRPRGTATTKAPKIAGMVMISERPAEAADRAVPGHWEGDLILGSNCRSAIATLVERQSRYVMLVHLPGGNHSATTVRDGLLKTIATLPQHPRKSLTRDQGTELARHVEITLATKMDIYFCDPHSPWQRGSNENTNGLLRQYFPKGTDLSVHSPDRLLEVAAELNGRPRKTLGWATPAEAMQRLLFDPSQPIVATTA